MAPPLMREMAAVHQEFVLWWGREPSPTWNSSDSTLWRTELMPPSWKTADYAGCEPAPCAALLLSE